MPSREDQLTDNILSLLRDSAGNDSKWRVFLEGIHLYRITHGKLDCIPEWTLKTIMPASPLLPEDVVGDDLTGNEIEQKGLPPALQGTDWDARSTRPDIILKHQYVYLTIEVKGKTGEFHSTGQPLLYARSLVLTPPGNDPKRKRASLLAAPREFFARGYIVRSWETWQLEFRRLQERDGNFYWGIILAEDVESVLG